MATTELEIILLIVIVGMLVGVIYSLRRIFILEKAIGALDKRIVNNLLRKKKK